MKRTLSVPLIAAALLVALGSGYWFGTRRSAPPAAVGTSAPASGTGADARRILYYRNPMGLPDTSPTPKKDSMGMDYIAVYADDAPDDAGVVRISPARVQTMGVRTATVDMVDLKAAVRAVGRVEVNERGIADVAPKFEGWIERLYVDATGDPVRRGQPLFTVYSPELVSARKELAIAEELGLASAEADPTARAAANRLADAARQRLKNWDIGAAAGQDPRRLTFTSPATGIVLEKKAVDGMRFTPGLPIYRIADLSTVWVIADVYEQDLARIKVGESADVVIDAFPGRHFAATVDYLYPTLNGPTRTTPVRLVLNNKAGLLRPGMFAHVELATGGNAPALAVPDSAVIDSGNRQVVLLALGAGRYQPQPVRLGRHGTGQVEILDGLKAGEQVVVSANFLIDAESNLKAALADFTTGEKLPAASGPAPLKRFHAVGRLDSIDVAAGSVSISHQAIPALKWPAMTMDFNLASPDLVRGIAPETPISFEFEERAPGEFVIVGMAAGTAGHGGH